MNRPHRRSVSLTELTTGALIVVGVLAVFLVYRPAPPPPLPVPNGYDDFLRAAKSLTGANYNIMWIDQDQLHALVATNSEALRLLRLGLSQRSSVPTEAAMANFPTHWRDLFGLKSLAMLLWGEGRIAEAENRPVDAARSYLDAICLGSKMSCGGFMMDRSEALACEGLVGTPLAKLIPKLPYDQMRPMAAKLEQIDGDTISWQEVVRNENRLVRLRMRKNLNPIKLAISWWRSLIPQRNFRKREEEKHDSAAARLRLLMAELALRCYRIDHGRAPESMQQLIPNYLQRVPLDPFNGHPLVYRPNGTNWVLYSVGPGQADPTALEIDYPVQTGGVVSDSLWSKNSVRLP